MDTTQGTRVKAVYQYRSGRKPTRTEIEGTIKNETRTKYDVAVLTEQGITLVRFSKRTHTAFADSIYGSWHRVE